MGDAKESADLAPAPDSHDRTFSDFITSPVFAVIVGTSPATKTFHMHSYLLAQGSDRLAIAITRAFQEKSEKTIRLSDENPDLFGFFVEYLYTNAGVVLPEPSGLDPASQCVVTARLYALGARLQARAFQRHALEEHNRRFSSNAKLPVYTICRLLKIVCEELPDRDRGRAEEDPLRAQIFAYTAKKMAALKAHPCFAELLDTQPLVGEWLCRWEGSAAREAPAEEITPEMDRSGPESAVV